MCLGKLAKATLDFGGMANVLCLGKLAKATLDFGKLANVLCLGKLAKATLLLLEWLERLHLLSGRAGLGQDWLPTGRKLELSCRLPLIVLHWAISH